MKKCLVIIMLVCFAFMLAGPPSLMADNNKAAKPVPPKSNTSSVLHENYKAPVKAAEPSHGAGAIFGFKLGIPWIPVILPFNPGTVGGDNNHLESSTDPNTKPTATDRVIGAGDDNGWVEGMQ